MRLATVALAFVFCTAPLSAADNADTSKPWYAQVKDFEPPNSGEHPRLLFRRCDLPALRKKSQTAEGKAILKRLRFLLDGKDGETSSTARSENRESASMRARGQSQ